MQKNTYTTGGIAHITGFSIRQLDYWASQNIVVPSAQKSHGPGTRRLYTFEDVVQFRFIRQLRNHGWSLQKIRKAISKLRLVMDDPNPLRSAVLIHNHRSILAICKTKEGEKVLVDALDPGGQQVMWIFLEALQAEVEELVFSQIDSQEISPTPS